jgi:hypothetical protein
MPGYQLSETNHHEKVYPVSPEWGRRAWVDQPKYKDWYEKAIGADGFLVRTWPQH